MNTYTKEDLENMYHNGRISALQDASLAISDAIAYRSWCIATGKFIPNYSQIEMDAVMRNRKIHGFTSWEEEKRIRDEESENGTTLYEATDYERESTYPNMIKSFCGLREESGITPFKIE